MQITIAPKPDAYGSFHALDRDRAGWCAYFGAIIAADERTKGRLLDIGCGADLPEPSPFRAIDERASRLDGVDPGPGVKDHPRLTQRWHGTLEASDIPAGAYDAAVAYTVVEHIVDPARFLGAVHRVLRPGGVFYGTTPHGRHPFALISYTIQSLGLKRSFAASTDAKVNDYPAYYRLNTKRAVVRAARAAGFSAATFYYYPCVQWDVYFPRALRAIPHLYDRALGARFEPFAQQFMFKLEKAR